MAKILVVEDEIIVAWDIKETLEKLGHTVVDLVVSGAEALGSAFHEQPDLVLMDIRLEGDIDGITAGDEIYHQLNIPVVYLTAHADEITLARATKTDPFGYIIKPFQSQSLQSTIKVALQRHQVEESAYLTQACLENTLNSIGNAIIATDCLGLITLINPTAEALTGWDSADAVGMEIDRVFRLTSEMDGTEFENPNLEAIWSKQPVKSPDRCWLVSKHSVQIPISNTATPIIKPNGEIIGSMIIFQDQTTSLTAELDLWDRNQDLEFFQLRLISQLQTKTAEHQQAISCIEVLNLVLTKIHTVKSEDEIIKIAIEQLGIAIDADYCWVTLHDLPGAISRIVCEYINTERQLYPTSKIGKEIDLLLYPEFYNHLLEIGDWIDPPLDIIPKPYLDLLTLTSQMLIAPIILDSHTIRSPSEAQNHRMIGEFGIITTGKAHWTSFQLHLITQTISYTIQLFRQTHNQPFNHQVSKPMFSGFTPEASTSPAIVTSPENIDSIDIALSIEWLNGLRDDFSNSIVNVNRDMHISAEMLKHQIYSFNVETENPSVVRHHQFLHHELAVNLETLQAEWHRQFQLIDILIDVQTNGTTCQIQSLNDILFRKWIATIVKNCADLADRYHLDFTYQMTEKLPQILLCSFPVLELTILEMFNNACKYTPPYYPIILEVDIRDRQLQVNVVSFEIEISAQELETMFIPFTPNQHDLSRQHGSTGVGLALVKRLLPHLGGNIHAQSDHHSTRLLLTVPMVGKELHN
jgi:PAS domain S-box-containing protein